MPAGDSRLYCNSVTHSERGHVWAKLNHSPVFAGECQQDALPFFRTQGVFMPRLDLAKVVPGRICPGLRASRQNPLQSIKAKWWQVCVYRPTLCLGDLPCAFMADHHGSADNEVRYPSLRWQMVRW